jgi:hypothetical protein
MGSFVASVLSLAIVVEKGTIMRLYSYVVARDFGFAPNPFYGCCTLATCKPVLRRTAQVGDWVIGTGSATRKRDGYLVYAMLVAETLTFDDYWDDARFRGKRPNLQGSKKQAFGDNIYHRAGGNGAWHQADSHHSLKDGSANERNIVNDTQTDKVLIATDFVYFGSEGPQIPNSLRAADGEDVCAARGHKNNFSSSLVTDVVAWIRSLEVHGYAGMPLDWSRSL